MATSRILGPDGQPIQTADLVEPQTSRLGHLQRELQSHPTRGLTPSRLASILDSAENGDLIAQFELYEDIEEKDGHVASEMSKRRRALMLDWDIVPPDNATPAEKKVADQLTELLGEIESFEDILFDTTDAIGKGFVCQEIEWHRVERYWLPKTITHRPQSWFSLHRGYRQELRLRTNTTVDGIQGEPLNPFGWITHVHKAKSGYIERAAMFRQLVWPYLFKNYSVGDLAEFLELVGVLRLGKYPASASEPEKATLLRALSSIGHSASGIIPEGMLIDFKEVAPGDPAAFGLMIDWCEKTQSKVILGGTLTSGADGKSSTNALGNVHNEVRKDLRDGDIRQVQGTITSKLVHAIATINGLVPDGLRRAPVFRLSAQETEDLKVFADALPRLADYGARVPVQWTHEKLGIPEPQGDEPVLVPPSRAAAPAPVDQVSQVIAAATARMFGAFPWAALAASPTSAQARPPQLMAGRLAADLAPTVDGWIDSIRTLVQDAQSLADIRDGLDQLLPGMTLDQYAAAMAEALRAAELAGRYEVLQEAGGAGL